MKKIIFILSGLFLFANSFSQTKPKAPVDMYFVPSGSLEIKDDTAVNKISVQGFFMSNEITNKQYLTFPFQYLTVSETDSLRSIAQTQVRIGGRSVYLAESILFEYYHPIDAEVSARKEMEDEKIIDTYTIYPNPNSGICFLHKNIKSNLILYVLDITGREISSKKITNEFEVIDLNQLSSATYILKLTDENKTLVGVEKINLIK